MQWVLGNLGAIPTVSIDCRTYEAQGWTIDATTDGTAANSTRAMACSWHREGRQAHAHMTLIAPSLRPLPGLENMFTGG